MLDLLGTIGANILSLPGILGVALGMTTRNWIVGMLLGGAVGIVETVIFAGFSLAAIDPLEFGVALCVGLAAGALGTGIRLIGTTV